MGLGWPELLIVLVIVLLIFGPGRLVRLGDAIGRGIRDLRRGARSEDDKGS